MCIRDRSVGVTFHGSSSPNAILNRSRLPDVMSPLFVCPLSVMTVRATRADQVNLRGPNPPDLARSLKELEMAPLLGLGVVHRTRLLPAAIDWARETPHRGGNRGTDRGDHLRGGNLSASLSTGPQVTT